MAVKLKLGVVAGSTPDRFAALADWLRASSGLELESQVAGSYEELVRSLRDGSSDAAWLPPVAYAWLAEAVTPIGCVVRDPGATYACALVVREDSPAQTKDDLAGLRAGWVEPWSAAGYVVPRLELARAKVAPFREQKFWGSHRAALLALARGDCDVAATYARTRLADGVLEGGWSDVAELRARVLTTFGPIPSDVIAIRRNAAPTEYEALANGLRLACNDAEGKACMRGFFGGDALQEVTSNHARLRLAYERGVANGLFD